MKWSATARHPSFFVAELASSMVDRVGLQEYLQASSLASSRAFYVDEHHGECLVPLADLFNHKAALLPAGVTLEGEQESQRPAQRRPATKHASFCLSECKLPHVTMQDSATTRMLLLTACKLSMEHASFCYKACKLLLYHESFCWQHASISSNM